MILPRDIKTPKRARVALVSKASNSAYRQQSRRKRNRYSKHMVKNRQMRTKAVARILWLLDCGSEGNAGMCSMNARGGDVVTSEGGDCASHNTLILHALHLPVIYLVFRIARGQHDGFVLYDYLQSTSS